MITRRTFLGSSALAVLAHGGPFRPSVASAAPKVGLPAPVFTSTATDGKSVGLGDHKGKIVVLEWTNHDCPYVRKHYETGNMQAIQ
jgi:hypothetical protein